MISIIIPVHNQIAYTRACIDALYRTSSVAGGFEVILVDDASTDATSSYARALASRVSNFRYVRNDVNLGFAATCNHGARVAAGGSLVFLNNDTIPTDGWLDALALALERYSRAGIVGSKLLFPEAVPGPQGYRVQHCGIVFGHHKESKHLYKFCLSSQPFIDRAREVQAVTAAACIVRKETFDRVGGFDEGYHNGAEDLDLCFRVRGEGWKVWYCPESVLFHHESVTIRSVGQSGHSSDDTNYRRFLDRWRDVIVDDELETYRADGLSLPKQGSMRIAMASPLEPQKSGIADYVQELLPYLSSHCRIDLFVDDFVPTNTDLLARHQVYRIDDLEWVNWIHRYDQIVYHIGNNRLHQAIYKASQRFPGVVILHEYDSKGCSNDRTNKELLQGLFDHAKGVIVHNDHSRRLLQPEFPHVPIEVIPHLLSPHSVRADAARTALARHTLGIPDGTFLVVSLGLVQEHKRSHVALRAFARFVQTCPDSLFVLGGDVPDPDFKNRLESIVRSQGLQDKVRFTGWLPETAFFDLLAAADVTINLRYPSRGEESGSLTRILGSGKPAIVSNYAQYADLPDEIVVKIGFDDEESDLATSLSRLHSDLDLRRRLADRASTYIAERNAIERVAELYAAFCGNTAQRPTGRCTTYSPGTESGVLFQAPLWDDRSPYRELVLALDRLGVPIRVEASFLSEELTSRIDIRSRQRLRELEDMPLAKNPIQVYAGPTEFFERHHEARASIVLLDHSGAGSCSTLLSRGADHFIVPSQFSRSRLERAGVPGTRISIVPHGVSGLLYGTTIQGWLPPRQFSFLCMIDPATDSRWQQVALAFLQQFHGRNDVTLHFKILSCDGQQGDGLRHMNTLWWEFSQKHPEFRPEDYRAVLTDQNDLPADEMPFYYCGFNCYVFPRTDSSFGRSLVEAMALGIPVIAPRAGGHTDIIGDRHALLFDGSTELKQCMKRVVDDPAQRQAKGITARNFVLSELTSFHAARRMQETLEEISAASLAAPREMILPPLAEPKAEPATGQQAIRDDDAFVFRSDVGDESRMPGPVIHRELPPILWNAPFGNPSGYASEAINFVMPLADLRSFAIASRGDVSQKFIGELPGHVRQILGYLERQRVPRGEYIGIQHFPASGFRFDPNAAYRIGRTMFETDRLPVPWVDLCNMMDEVWVPTEFNMGTFASSGVAKEKLVKIPGAIDVHLFDPDKHEPLDLPGKRGFNFLSVFEWLERKGWDVLLAAYFEAFSAQDDVCLFLRTYLVGRHDRNDAENILRRIRGFARRLGHNPETLPPVIVIDAQIPFTQLPRLYKSVDAFVLPSRGEGWGRPYMEAMAMGLPTIGTAWSGNTEFMETRNSYLIEVERLATIKQTEHSHYLGHQWAEPSRAHLVSLMRRVYEKRTEATEVGNRARRDIVARYSAKRVADVVLERLDAARSRMKKPTGPQSSEVGLVAWEGPFFSTQSLAIINRELCSRLIRDRFDIALISTGEDRTSMARPRSLPVLEGCVRQSVPGASVHIYLLWPANLKPPESGHWVVIQPWEFGSLPKKWVETFGTLADEMWVPSTFVRQEYIESGIPADRVFVVPAGVDPAKFHSGVPPYRLRTKKGFRFLFVGGTILRKGIDLLLRAYVSAFKATDDVCLVIKDMGGNSFYSGQTFKQQIQELMQRLDVPAIEYIDAVMSEHDLAGLYGACNVLVHPYRGEGFGMPILEAMACGLPAIVTNGGACLDFCTHENSLLVNAHRTVLEERKVGGEDLVGNVWFYEPDFDDLKTKMLEAYHAPDLLRQRGNRAAHDASTSWTWEASYAVVKERLVALARRPIRRESLQNETVVPQERSFADEGPQSPNNQSTRIIAMNETPMNVDQLLTRAWGLLDQGDVDGVIEVIARAETLLPQGEKATDPLRSMCELVKGHVNLARGESGTAKTCFEKALNLDPGSGGACVGLGAIFLGQGQPEAAKTMYEWGVKNDPANRAAVAGLASANRLLGLPSDHNALAIEALPEQPAVKEVDVTAVQTESAFARAIDLLFSKFRPRKIIESGTYLGTGTTTIIASAIKRYAIGDAVFYTIEVNPRHYRLAKENLEKNDMMGYVLPLNGLSVPRFLLPTFDQIEQRCVNDLDSTKLYVDHPLDVRAQRYFGETNFDGVPDDLLGRCLKEFDGRPDFVLLDSGGHMGHIEFNYLVSKLRGPCFIALDDVLHVKHHKSFVQMQNDPRFEILIAANEKMGFAIARFNPGPTAVENQERTPDLNALLAGAYSSFERKDFSGALATLAEAEHLLDETGILASHSQARVGFENLKGLNYLGLNQLDEARASFEEALRVDPQSTQACAGLGEVFYLAGLDREAKTMYEQAVLHGPQNQFGIAGLAKVNRQLGLPDSHMTLP